MKVFLKRVVLFGVSSLALAAVPASAVTTINWAPQSTDSGSTSDFDLAQQFFPGVFANTLKFDVDPNNGYLGGGYFHNHSTGAGFTISAIVNGLSQQIFASGPLSGADHALTSFGTFSFAGGNVTGVTLLSNQSISQGFHSFQPSQTFTLDSVGAAAVPEPATWLTMILGFGAIGFGMRRKHSQTVRYSFA